MSRSPSPPRKAALDHDYDSDEEPLLATAWAHAQPQATIAPKKAKKTATEVFAKELLQALTESQATAQQILKDKMEITTLVQGLGKTELNAPKLRKLTKEDFIKFVDLYEVYVASDGRDRMVELITPSSLGYAAFLCKMTKDPLKMTSD